MYALCQVGCRHWANDKDSDQQMNKTERLVFWTLAAAILVMVAVLFSACQMPLRNEAVQEILMDNL